MRRPLASAFWIRWLVLVASCGGARERANLRLASPAPRRVVAVFLFGETYRGGAQHSRTTETTGTERTQGLASTSQMDNLITPILRAGYDVVCFLATEVNSTSARQGLLEWYKDCMPPAVRALTSFDQPNRTFANVRASYRNYTKAGHADADYFILLRPDLILKKNLFSLWDHAKESVAFPFREWCVWADGHAYGCLGRPADDCWRVPDVLVAFPRQALGIVPPMNHHLFLSFNNAMDKLRSFNPNYQNDSVTFWLQENHDADTEKDWNPLYAISGRAENDKDEQCGQKTTIQNPTTDSSPSHVRIRHESYANRTGLWRRLRIQNNTILGNKERDREEPKITRPGCPGTPCTLLPGSHGSLASLRPAAPAPKRAVAVFLFGETYRDGGQKWRTTETDGTERTQGLASKSQMDNLITPILHAGYDVVCFLATEVNSTSARQGLLEWYKDCMPPAVRARAIFDQPVKSRKYANVRDSYRNYIAAGHAEADYFILLRPDLILKKNVFSLWDQEKESVAFPFREWCVWADGHAHGCKGRPNEDCWRVPDTMLAFPRRALEIVDREGGHWMFVRVNNAMYRSFNATYRNDNVTFWLKENHDADTEKDWNPLYAISGRAENDKDEQCGNGTTIQNPTIDSSPANWRIRHEAYANRTGVWRRVSLQGNTTKGEGNEPRIKRPGNQPW